MMALNRIQLVASTKMPHYVYLENASGISIYTPFFNFHGDSIEKLAEEIRARLNVPENSNMVVMVFTHRQGCTLRKRLTDTIPDEIEDVYVTLK
jgi:hypothetical protein